MTHKIYPHKEPVELAPGLWQLEGSLPIPLPRMMTIWRLPSGGLLLYSVIALDEAGMTKLEALGKPEIMVIPHTLHMMDAPFYKARYPDLRVLALPEAQQALAKRGVPTDEDPLRALPSLGLRAYRVEGVSYGEVAIELPLAGGGHALQLTDAVSTLAPKGIMMALLGPPGGRAGVPRLVRIRQMRDKQAVATFLRARATPELRLLLVAHGPPESADPRGLLEHAASTLGA